MESMARTADFGRASEPVKVIARSDARVWFATGSGKTETMLALAKTWPLAPGKRPWYA